MTQTAHDRTDARPAKPRHVAFITIILGTVMLAGCLGDDNAVAPNAPDDTTSSQQQSADGEPNTDPSPTADDPDTDDDNAGNGPPTEVRYEERPFEATGRLGWEIIVFTPVNNIEERITAAARFFPVTHDAPIAAAHLTLTWDDTNTINRELRLGLARNCDANGCSSYDYAQGSSPLTYEADTVPGGDLDVFVFTPNRGPLDAISLYATAEQPFTIKGTFTVNATQAPEAT